MQITQKDRQRLRSLALTQAELAHSPEMEALKKQWQLHGSFAQSSRPMMTVELGTFRDEIVPPLLQCTGEQARVVETQLLSGIVNHTLFHDDSVVKDYFPVYYDTHFLPFGIQEHRVQTQGLGHQFVPVIGDLQEDFHLLKKSEFGVDMDSVQRKQAFYGELFGDILPVQLRMNAMCFCPTQNVLHLMGMENMYIAMADYPELFLQMMEMLTDDMLAYTDLLEQKGLLLPTYGDAHLNQGTYCYNAVLPQTGTGLRADQILVYLDSQESAGISPEMYTEFVFPFYKKIADRFGLLSYGCCEAVDPIWECAVSKYSNLFKVSISPWCNEEFMGERLQGRNIMYLRKPFPNDLGVGAALDEDAVRLHIGKTVSAARGCTLEFACRDVYSVNNDPGKVRRYVEIMRECCEKHRK